MQHTIYFKFKDKTGSRQYRHNGMILADNKEIRETLWKIMEEKAVVRTFRTGNRTIINITTSKDVVNTSFVQFVREFISTF